MSNKRPLVFLALLSALFVYTSCIETDKSLGSQFTPDEFVLQVHTDEFEIPVISSALDSIQGYNSSYMTFGYINDETFGYTSGGFATNIAPYSDSTYLGINPEVRSVYMYMYIDSTSVLREDQRGIPQNISIYQLKSDLDSLKMFNNSISTDDYYPTPISQGSPVFFGDDSLKIYFTPEFGQQLLAASTAEHDSLTLFLERIKGIYFTSDNPDINPGEGRLNYTTIASTTIYLHYYLTDPQRGFYRKDTMETYTLGYGHAINTLKTSSGKLASDNTSELLFIESIDGVKPKIKASDLKNILNTWISSKGFSKEGILVSRATLEFPFEFDYENYSDYSLIYPQQIYPCTYDESLGNNYRFLTPLPEIFFHTSIGMMNRSLCKYTCDITNYIQDLIKMEEVTTKSDLYISPILSYEAASTSSSSYDYMMMMYYGFGYGYDTGGEMYYGLDNQDYRHGILNGSEFNGRRPTLRITYSYINQ